MSDIERYNYAFDPDGDEWAARLLRRLPPQGSVLELGPGPGAMTRVMVDRGYSVTVVEYDPGALESLTSMGVEVIAGNLETEDWVKQLEGRRFDAILACDVLEHLRWPDHVLKALTSLMQPMGQLVISIPNVSYAGIVAGLMHGTFDYTQTGLLDQTHIRFFTRRSMEKALLEYGWTPRTWEPYRLPVERSEFAWCWSALPDAQRQNLASACSDFDVYEWMVVATLSIDAPAWEIKEARVAAEKLRDEMLAMKVQHAQEHASLLEHQKAFAEAKVIIGTQQQEVEALRSGLEKQKIQMLQMQQLQQLQQLQPVQQLPFPQLPQYRESWFGRLRRWLR